LLDHRRSEIGSQQLLLRAAGELAVGVIGIGDAASGASHDEVALGFEEAAGALLGLL
jgi:hypothetical protein